MNDKTDFESNIDPFISIIMANYNCAAYIKSAISSAQAQTLPSLEIIVADDASTDDSLAIADAIAASDPRVVVLRTDQNHGPGAARNRAIAIARGQWLAILDSDDLMAPTRLAMLTTTAERDHVDIIADDLAIFSDDDADDGQRLLTPLWRDHPFDLGLIDFIKGNCLYAAFPGFGYLKPVIRARTLHESGVRYNEALRIAEDYDLILRLLARGARYRVHPQPLYRYRRRSSSISHRLSVATVTAMREGDAAFRRDHPDLSAEVVAMLDQRLHSVDRALAFELLVCALKERRFGDALAVGIRSPRCLPLLRLPLMARFAALRQRRANGSSTEIPNH